MRAAPLHQLSQKRDIGGVTLKLKQFETLAAVLHTEFQKGVARAKGGRQGEVYLSVDEYADVDWDKLGFRLMETDYMYIMKCCQDDEFSHGHLNRYGNIELSPSAGVLNYAQGLFEGLKAYRKVNGNGFLIFRPEENARRMQIGSDRMCMPSPSVEQFVHAVKQTVLANKRWIPPPGKGSLYVRPLLMGSGPILGLAPASEYTFLVYAAPVGNYFKEGLAPINLVIQDESYRATPGGTGAVKTIANYSPVLKAQMQAKKKGFTDVLFLDAVDNKYLEEASSCNIFIRKVDERLVSVEDLTDADEVFCTGTAVVVAPVNSITYKGQRYKYNCGEDAVSRKLYKSLTDIQMGIAEDKKGWTVEID
ncbi:Branched-chain-amino-acid aminotransferase 3, chloroplastic [Dendrobium catenatum]|uniref:Branched-chain-amino-acid aminotransferase 3, chloroplastic n=1 Tax=Dendrobium catenatum TaxID=906689 RepID=A0A2I0WYQ9_9ASPA|nr:Branched-chain-amino-acid aminotransferase 3, chloroplastic [Dendrobium catenatum]